MCTTKKKLNNQGMISTICLRTKCFTFILSFYKIQYKHLLIRILNLKKPYLSKKPPIIHKVQYMINLFFEYFIFYEFIYNKKINT